MARRGGEVIRQGEVLLGRIEETLAIAFLIGIAGVVNIQIIARYFLNSPLIWAEEAAKILMIWLAYVGAGAVTHRSAHIAVDSLPGLLPPTAARVVGALLQAVMAVLFVLLAWLSMDLMRRVGGMQLIGTGLPTAILILPVLIGSGLIALHSVLRVFMPVESPPGTSTLPPQRESAS